MDDAAHASAPTRSSEPQVVVHLDLALPTQQDVHRWLVGRFCERPGRSMCKREVYADYIAYCRANGHEPTNPSSFGKLVHSVFPAVGTRRIGTRGQSLPHYNNFARREPGDPPRQLRQQQQQRSEHTAHRPSQQRPHRGREPQPQRPVPADGGGDDEEEEEEEERVEHQQQRPEPGLPLPPLPPSQHLRSKRRHHPSLPPSSSTSSSSSSSLPSSPPVRKRLRVTERSAAEEAAVRDRSAVVGVEAAGGVGHRAAIWTSDAHLGLLNVGNGYRTMFFEFSWPLFPLHPAALHGDNLYYLLCTKEGQEERSPLSLSVNFVLSVGSLLTGDVVRAKEFFMNARDILGDLFDQTDYDIAQVLLPMASYTDYWLPPEESSRVRMYYLTLASQICEHLGALNSNAYFRCLIGFMSSVGGFSLSEAEFERRWEEAKQAPAWPIHLSAQGHHTGTADASHLHSTHSTHSTPVGGGGQRESSWEPGATGIEVEFREEPLPLHTHRLMHLTCRPIVNVMKGIFLYKMGGAPDAAFLAQLLPAVDRLEREVEAHMYSDTPVHYCLYYILVLHIKALKAECYALLGYTGLAARLARAFVQLAEQAGREYVTYCFTLIRDVVGLMVDLLLRAGDWAAVRALLGLIEHRIPYLAGVAGRYLAALRAAEEAAGLASSFAAAAGDPARPMSDALALALSQHQQQRQQGEASSHVPSPPTALVAGLASASPSPASTSAFSTPPTIVVVPHSEQRLQMPPHFPGGT